MHSRPVHPAGSQIKGLAWRYRRRTDRWTAYWVAKPELAKRGFSPKTVTLCTFPGDLTPDDWSRLEAQCETWEAKQTKWASLNPDAPTIFDGTFRGLIQIYRTDPDSPMNAADGLRWTSKGIYQSRLRTIEAAIGDVRLSDTNFRDFKRWYQAWGVKVGDDAQHLDRAASLINMLRTVIRFGIVTEITECERLATVLAAMNFPAGQPRTEYLTAEQVIAIRAEAHRRKRPSVALAQAIMFELMLRQRDVIGEWLPAAEPGTTDIVRGDLKWLHGLRWSDIENGILTKRLSKSLKGRQAVTRKAGKTKSFDLSAYPMVMEEINLAGGLQVARTGPMIVSERTRMPWRQTTFRALWRLIARKCGIPDTVQNRDSRAGGVTEAAHAGASIDQIRQHAGHSHVNMTARYSRASIEADSEIARLRAERRARPNDPRTNSKTRS